jgi:5-formyltetrahydrofolate cyclo-ligase
MLHSDKPLIQQKEALRKQMLTLRKQVSKNEREKVQIRVCQELESIASHSKSKVIHSFLPMGHELNHRAFLEKYLNLGVTIVTTKTLPNRQLTHLQLNDFNDLEDGVFGTKYPRNGLEWSTGYDIILVPGLAFDSKNNRLGYGGGYYDTFLAQHPNSLKIAICFPFQVLPAIPTETHDQKVDRIVC